MKSITVINKFRAVLMILFIILLLVSSVYGQAPDKMNYQAVIRNSSNQLVTNQAIGMQISILQGSPIGSAVYVETQAPTTNANGLVTIEIGGGTVVSGIFSDIDWTNGPYFIKTETDPTTGAGTTYTITGTSQLLSVPYALHAKTVENADDEDADPANELQALSINNDTLYLSNGGEVYLGYLFDNTDSQKLMVNDFYLGITNGNEVTLPSLWKRIGQDIYYDSGKVSIITLKGNIQLELPDVFGAGGRNLIIGDDVYLSDVDMMNTLGIYGNSDSTIGAIKLGSDGPILSGCDTALVVNKKINMNNQNIVHVAYPVNDQDAATKEYVDALLARIEELESQPGIVKDYDGNIYTTVRIGNQEWLGENLKNTHCNDGTAIPLITGSEWSSLTTPAYCWYNNDSASSEDAYGKLYNWFAVDTGILCPTGWHVPTDAEWTILTDNLGGADIAGGKLKEIGTIHWTSPNNYATNESGFTARGGGTRYNTGGFNEKGLLGYWWSSSENYTNTAWYRRLYHSAGEVSRIDGGKEKGCSVRCIKD